MGILRTAERRSLSKAVGLALLCVFGKQALRHTLLRLQGWTLHKRGMINSAVALSLRTALPGSSMFCNQTLAHSNVSERSASLRSIQFCRWNTIKNQVSPIPNKPFKWYFFLSIQDTVCRKCHVYKASNFLRIFLSTWRSYFVFFLSWA